ncbi:glycosyltransferase family 2 protein [Methanobacterium petrolearium]|uniref:glycosyltransferase family 2 protein n=1 Tax=Methanobacterium petrolearium TaxID=710190 RepID=UPI001FD73E16|nr:glycosyltransferase family 2 protein [Methanobacterium petrolearium]MBP1945594.1 glycosyltransferase involved in cell wall biosynthesis [Methanobacterium petrolearium]BDZ71816.1 dolichol-phosphate mannosyltransferase [Methanobacterium petrolearium]
MIIPMYNEEDNVLITLEEVKKVLKTYDSYQILAVNDGSGDQTLQLLEEFAKENPELEVLNHPVNMGMGRALRTGFEKAEGDVIITLDADLSYDPKYITELIHELRENHLDIVIGSQYMDGGETEDIPFIRLFVSKMANKIVGCALDEKISTVTGILRAYRKEVIDSIEIESSGTEINPEILSKAIAIGFEVKEIPVKLKGRKLGESKVQFRSTTTSHLLFTFHERPMMLFGVIGLILCLIGIIIAIYLFYEYLIGTLDPTRPLMFVMVLLIISGIQILMFGFVATQISLLKREIYVIQKENKLLRKKFNKKDSQ